MSYKDSTRRVSSDGAFKEFLSKHRKTLPEQKRVLLVDDDYDHLQLFKLLIEGYGFEVVTACSADDAINLLCDDEPVDVMVTDAQMPGVNGLSLIEAVRLSLNHRSLPIVVMTASCPEALSWTKGTNGPDMFCYKRDASELLEGQLHFLMG